MKILVPKEAFGLIRYAHPTSGGTYRLDALHLRATDDELFFEATDGKRLFRMATPRLDADTGDCDILMPRELAWAATRMRGDTLKVLLDGSRLTVAELLPSDSMRCTMPTASGKFRTTGEVMAPQPDDEKAVLSVDARLMGEIAESLAAITRQFPDGRTFSLVEIPHDKKLPYRITANAEGDSGTTLSVVLMPVYRADAEP